MEKLITWIIEEMERRGWSAPEVERRSKRGGYEGISASMIYKVINEHANPGQKFYEGIARAFDVSTEHVMRMTGYWSETPQDQQDAETILALFRELPEEIRPHIINAMRGMVERRKVTNNAADE